MFRKKVSFQLFTKLLIAIAAMEFLGFFFSVSLGK